MAFSRTGPAISATEALKLALQVSRSSYDVHGQRAKKTTKAVKVRAGSIRSGDIKNAVPGRTIDRVMLAPERQARVQMTGSAESRGSLGELDFLMQRLKAKLLDVGIVSTAKVRLRPARGPERRLNVEFYPDPAEQGVVFLRLSPAGPKEGIDKPMVAGAAVEQLVTPQEVAEMLGVSRPYAAKLCDSKVFGHVDVSRGGHRKVALSRVRDYIAAREAMSTALDEMAELTRGAQAHDAEKAARLREASGRVWVKTKAAGAK
jgi:excisionase family DNA binding protein